MLSTANQTQGSLATSKARCGARQLAGSKQVVCAAALVLASMLAAAPANAGARRVRDVDGSLLAVVEDPSEGAQGYVIERRDPDGKPDRLFGHEGVSAVSAGAADYAPTSMRVDSAHRIWIVGAGMAADQPQAIVERFLPDGTPDVQWGIQGKVQLNPSGIAVRPNDLLPLSDGSVLVAGVAANLMWRQAIVFHLKADGTLDTAFGTGGIWQRLAPGDDSLAASFGTRSDGSVAVAVAARSQKQTAELWTLSDGPPKLVQQQAMDDESEGENLRAEWSGDRWLFNMNTGPAPVVAAAFLTTKPVTRDTDASPNDSGLGTLNFFAAREASPPPQSASNGGLPWKAIGGVAVLTMLIAALVARWRSRR